MVTCLYLCITRYKYSFIVTHKSADSCSLRQTNIFYQSAGDTSIFFNYKFSYICICKCQALHILDIGMKPFVVFDFMPSALASGEKTEETAEK